MHTNPYYKELSLSQFILSMSEGARPFTKPPYFKLLSSQVAALSFSGGTLPLYHLGLSNFVVGTADEKLCCVVCILTLFIALVFNRPGVAGAVL